MLKKLFVAFSLLAVATLTGCAGLAEKCDQVDSDPAIVARLSGKWKIERQLFDQERNVSSQAGTAVGEMIGQSVRLWSPELKLEILFGIRQDGEYALIEVNSTCARMLVGKDADEEDEDDDFVENNQDINFKFGRELCGEIKFPSENTIEICYFSKRGDQEIAKEKILLTRIP